MRGTDVAEGKVACTMMPIGRTEHNVFHDNSGFGWYINGHFPLDVQVDADGYVQSWAQTVPFNPITGADQAKPTYLSHNGALAAHAARRTPRTPMPRVAAPMPRVAAPMPRVAAPMPHAARRSHLCRSSPHAAPSTRATRVDTSSSRTVEFHNDFSFGVYDLGDVTMDNLTSIDGVKAHYWKTYRRGSASGPFMRNSVLRSVGQAPGGAALVEFDSVTFLRDQVDLNHHCGLDGEATGGLCASHFWIHNETRASIA